MNLPEIQGDPWTLLLFIVLGLVVGIVSGALPGLSVLTAVVVFMPVTYAMTVENSLAFLVAMYAGGVYGGSTIAILLNMPGAPENACTAIDGYPLTRKGYAAPAVATAILSSGLGGLFGAIVLITVSPLLAQVAIEINPAQILAIVFLALCASGVFDLARSTRAYIAVLTGVGLASIGFSPLSGVSRFTFGANILNTGIDFVALIIGALALSEVFVRIYNHSKDGDEYQAPNYSDQRLGALRLPDRHTLRRLLPVWARNGLLGSAIGILPGAGATASSFMAYSAEKRINRRGYAFGTGEYAGVAAPETANNAAAMTTLIPLLVLGIPGGAVAAVLYGVFTMNGIQPGPQIAATQSGLLWTIYITAIVSSLLILVFGVVEAHNTVKLLKVPEYYLLPLVIVFAVIGSYTLNNNIFDVWVTIAFGVIGAIMRINGYSVVALALGVILGPIMENAFLVGYNSSGTYLFFLHDSVSIGVIIVSCLLIAVPLIAKRMRKNAESQYTGA